ncbi:MAG: hypothetical protein NTZ97_03530 [Candidatus Moranbacteria bacterium]|nr:hypothetical protein [Candidatus Moranbacteria bacterium]
MSNVYKEWKKITDLMYGGLLSDTQATEAIITLLYNNGIKKRSDGHVLLAKSYFVYDKDKYSDPQVEKPLGLGLVYLKPDKTKTQDIFIVSPASKLDRFYSEKEMIKKYPAMEGVHKNNLPV